LSKISVHPNFLRRHRIFDRSDHVCLRDFRTNFLLVASIIRCSALGKWIAAWAIGRAFGYSRNETAHDLVATLPQVAATLAATLAAHDTLGAAGERLLDDRMLNVVLCSCLRRQSRSGVDGRFASCLDDR